MKVFATIWIYDDDAYMFYNSKNKIKKFAKNYSTKNINKP